MVYLNVYITEMWSFRPVRYSITKPVAVGVIVILYRSKSPSSWTEQLVFFFFLLLQHYTYGVILCAHVYE